MSKIITAFYMEEDVPYLSGISHNNQVLRRECGGRNSKNRKRRDTYRRTQREIKAICDNARRIRCQAIKGDPSLTEAETFKRISNAEKDLDVCYKRRKGLRERCFIPPAKVRDFKTHDVAGFNDMVESARRHAVEENNMRLTRNECGRIRNGIDKRRTKTLKNRSATQNERATQSKLDRERSQREKTLYSEAVSRIGADIETLGDSRGAEEVESKVNSIRAQISELPKTYHHKLNTALTHKNSQMRATRRSRGAKARRRRTTRRGAKTRRGARARRRR